MYVNVSRLAIGREEIWFGSPSFRRKKIGIGHKRDQMSFRHCHRSRPEIL